MKTLLAVALVILGLSLPGYAQRGGARGGGSVGHSGGIGFASRGSGFSGGGAFASRGAPGSRGSFSSIGRAGFMGGPRVNPPYRGSLPSNLRTIAPGAENRREGYGSAGYGGYRGNRGYRPDRYRQPYLPYVYYAVGLPYSVDWIPDNLDYPDDFDYGPDYDYGDDSYAAQPPDTGAYPASPYADYPPAPYAAAPDAGYPTGPYAAYPTPPDAAYAAVPYTGQPGAAPYDTYRPAYAPPTPAAPAPEAQTPVTLIFKDGRPPEQIHNYMLTRTTLYVQDQRVREIPVDALDLVAMAKVNDAVGIDFQVPK